MKRLRAVRLINWYHFIDQTFSFDGSCLIFGDNGSGKSTVLDAIQWALVADQALVRFNKAANEHSRRTLYGYVRYKLGSEDEDRPGQVRYGRKNATSHVILSFDDDEDDRGAFTAGVAMEALESEQRVDRFHWIAPSANAHWFPALDGNYVRTLKELKQQLRERHPQTKIFGDARTYRDEVRHRLGPLPESFHRLLVKSLDFKPIGKVKDFVFHYLLDDRPVDTAALQSNLEHYKRLEAEAVAAQARIRKLEGIVDQGQRVEKERDIERSHLYVSLRSKMEVHHEAVAVLHAEMDKTEQRRLEAADAIRSHERELQFLRDQRDQVVGTLQMNPTAQTIAELDRQLGRAREDLGHSKDADRLARTILAGQTGLLDRILSPKARDLRNLWSELFDKMSLVGASDVPDIVERLRETLRADGVLVGRDIRTWESRLVKVLTDLTVAKVRLEEQVARAKEEGAELEKERRDLDTGRHRYPDYAEALLHLLRTKLKGKREPRPLAELIEVPNERWRDAVEGFLNTRRFDVIVDPEDFQRALSLYEKNKHDYPLPGRGPVFISSVGLVDVEQIESKRPHADFGSLAEKVETDDPHARLYLDFIMGDVACVDNERDLREHKRAITDSVMVYQGHVARQTRRETYSRHYIGRAAVARRIDDIEKRLGELSEQMIRSADALAWLLESEKLAQSALGEAKRLPDLVEESRQIQNLEGEVVVLSRRLASIDRSEIAHLEEEKLQLDERIRAVTDLHRDGLGEQGRLEMKLQSHRERSAEQEEKERVARGELEEVFPGEWSHLEKRYFEVRAIDKAEDLEESYKRKHGIQRRNVENLVQKLVALKTEYVNEYGLAADKEGDKYGEFVSELEVWRESKLPQYRERIADVKKQAIQQLAEDVIFRLRENLNSVRRQIDDLNRALKDVPFGSERYSFSLEIAPEHRSFYDLLQEAGQYERDSLFGAQQLANPEVQQTLEDLFGRLTSGKAQEVKNELAERADYREYFRYDLKIHHADGTVSLYDRVAADKSGGETQTPYYVAILASMFRVYRSTSLSGRPLAGLVLLDEAFGKMDENRIRATLELARGLGLQLVMATPKERSELVAPHVETSLYIHKDALSGAPTVLDFTKEFEDDAALGLQALGT
jgi:uncharacterized protein YPO0396